MTENNGALRAMPAEVPASAKVNHELVRLLESALTDARSGRMVAGGVVAVVGASSFMAFGATGPYMAEMIAGAAVLSADVIAKMRQPRHSAIINPTRRQ